MESGRLHRGREEDPAAGPAAAGLGLWKESVQTTEAGREMPGSEDPFPISRQEPGRLRQTLNKTQH